MRFALAFLSSLAPVSILQDRHDNTLPHLVLLPCVLRNHDPSLEVLTLRVDDNFKDAADSKQCLSVM